MFLLHRKNIVRDGSHPVLLFGYGASSQVMGPGFGENAIAWLELGGVFAVPSLRGGGEFGRAWYEAGTLGRKQNTFDDFIAAAEYLIAELRAATTGGHGGNDFVEHAADVLAFAAQQFGMTTPAAWGQ